MSFLKNTGSLRPVVCAVVFILLSNGFARAQEEDPRIRGMRDADHYELHRPVITSLDQWKDRQRVMRETLLLRSGLWPEPEKCPLNAQVFDEREGEGFTVSKVYFESLPGFFATGNLYRPTRGEGPYPAVVTPHGHWSYGRLQNSESGSIPGRCIDFARMGFVVFSIDMVGYNDSFQLPHDPFKSRAQLKADEPLPYEPRKFRGDFDFPEAELYGFNLGGLQVWNAIRSVDFLVSLPEVDPDRIGVTGASGGASQAIFLMIADERIKVAAPVNIIGATKHPGCGCENMPGLWLDMSTVELAASFSPKPLLLMSATEDPWTHSTPEREYPMIRSYYKLYGAGNMVKNVHIDAGHNYNAETRAAVYAWFAKHLDAPFPPITNPVPVAPELKLLGDLRVFPDMILPEQAVSGFTVIENWKKASERAYETMLPVSESGLVQFNRMFRPMLARVLAWNHPSVDIERVNQSRGKLGNFDFMRDRIGLSGVKESFFDIESVYSRQSEAGNVLIVAPFERGGLLMNDGMTPHPWVSDLLAKGYAVFSIGGYAAGERFIPGKIWDSFSWSSTYNLSNELWGVHDIIIAMEALSNHSGSKPLSVVGIGECGLITAFACAVSGAAEKVVIDLDGCDPGYDGDLVDRFSVGAVRRVGDFRTAMLLLMDKPVTLLNAGPTFDISWYENMIKNLGFSRTFDLRTDEDPRHFTDLF